MHDFIFTIPDQVVKLQKRVKLKKTDVFIIHYLLSHFAARNRCNSVLCKSYHHFLDHNPNTHTEQLVVYRGILQLDRPTTLQSNPHLSTGLTAAI